MLREPKYMVVSPQMYDLYQFLMNTPPRQLARHYLALARKSRHNRELHAQYLRTAHGYIRDVLPKPPCPDPGDQVGWRKFYRRNDILFSRARGRKLSRILSERAEMYGAERE